MISSSTWSASYWARRNEPNLLFVHYNDMKADLGGEMRRVAAFLDIEIPESKWAAAIDRCSFESMRNVDAESGSDADGLRRRHSRASSSRAPTAAGAKS